MGVAGVFRHRRSARYPGVTSANVDTCGVLPTSSHIDGASYPIATTNALSYTKTYTKTTNTFPNA